MMDKQTLTAMMADPVLFRQHLLIDCDGKPRPLAQVVDPWQEQDFRQMDRAWKRAVGIPAEGGPQRAVLLRPRGHAKTSDQAASACWALVASRRQILGIAAAADSDQARLLRDSVSRLTRLNAWLADFLDVQAYRVENRRTGSRLEIISNDAGSSYGVLPDFILVDELCHWPARGEELWHSLLSSAAKRRHCVMVVITNSGVIDSWQHKVVETIRQSSDWHYHSLAGPQASWMDANRLAEQRAMLPASVYARLWENRWVSGAGDAIPEADLQRAITLPGPAFGREVGMIYGGGLDVGVRHDRTGFCVLGVRPGSGRVQLIWTEAWQPGAGGTVDLYAVERSIAWAHGTFGLCELRYDPSQAYYLAQRLSGRGLPTVPIPFVGQNLTSMARSLLEAFRQGRIALYHDEQLLDDLRRLSIVERNFGYKLVAPSDEKGHCDLGIAMSIILPGALGVALDGNYAVEAGPTRVYA